MREIAAFELLDRSAPDDDDPLIRGEREAGHDFRVLGSDLCSRRMS